MATLVDWSLDDAKLKRKLLQLSKSKLIKACKYKEVLSTGTKKEIIERLIKANTTKNSTTSRKSSNIKSIESKPNLKPSKSKTNKSKRKNKDFNIDTWMASKSKTSHWLLSLKNGDKLDVMVSRWCVGKVIEIKKINESDSFLVIQAGRSIQSISLSNLKNSPDQYHHKIQPLHSHSKMYHNAYAAKPCWRFNSAQGYTCKRCNQKCCRICNVVRIYDTSTRELVQSQCKDCYPVSKYSSIFAFIEKLFGSISEGKAIEIHIIIGIANYMFDISKGCENMAKRCGNRMDFGSLQIGNVDEHPVSYAWKALISSRNIIICDTCHLDTLRYPDKDCNIFHAEKFTQKCIYYDNCGKYLCSDCNEEQIVKNRCDHMKCESIICAKCKSGSYKSFGKCKSCNSGKLCKECESKSSVCEECAEAICMKCIGECSNYRCNNTEIKKVKRFICGKCDSNLVECIGCIEMYCTKCLKEVECAEEECHRKIFACNDCYDDELWCEEC